MSQTFDKERLRLNQILEDAKSRIRLKAATPKVDAKEQAERQAFDIWKHQPVSPREFITSPHFINDRVGGIWPALIEDMEAVFSKADKFGRSSYFPAVHYFLDDEGIGSGKSLKAALFNAYTAHLLLSLRDPLRYFNLFSSSILLMNVAPTESKARDIVFSKVSGLINRCAWFRETNNMPEARLKLSLKFYGHLNTHSMSEGELSELDRLEQQGKSTMPTLIIAPGSSVISAVTGADLFMGIVDEACSDGGFETEGHDKAGAIVANMDERRASRFHDDGIVMAISSAGNEERWMEREITKIEVVRKNASIPDSQLITEFDERRWLIRRRPSYVANPIYKKYFERGDTFTYVAQRETEEGIVLENKLEIPNMFQAKFMREPETSLRNICAISTVSTYRWITDWNGLISKINQDRSDPCPDNSADQPLTVEMVKQMLPPNWMGEQNKFFYCFPAGTRVLMANGEYKPIESITFDDVVFSGRGKKRKVEAVFAHRHLGEMVKIRLKGQKEVVSTDNHRFLVLSRKRLIPADKHYAHCMLYPETALSKKLSVKKEIYDPEWIEAKDICVGDYLCRPKIHTSSRNVVLNTYVQDDIAELLGWYIAEGSETSDGYLQFTLHEKEIAVAERLIDTWKNYGGNGYIYKHPTAKAIAVHLTKIREWADWVCRVAGSAKRGGKRIISDLLTCLDDNKLRILMKAWAAGDGYLHKSQLYISSSYRQLADFAQLAFTRLGFVSTEISVDSPVSDWNRRTAYRVTVSGKRQIEMLLNGASDLVRDKLHGFCFGNYEYVQVTSLEKFDDDIEVFDIQVANDHSFVANGFVVHNCHVDLATGGTESSGLDGAGLCIAHSGPEVKRGEEGNQISLPTVVVDLAIRLKTHGKSNKQQTESGAVVKASESTIKFAEIRDFLIWCHQVRNFKFAKITFDHYQSTDSIQILTELGYLCEQEPVTNDDYDTLADLWYDGRLDIFNDKHALWELRRLERKKSGKIEKSAGASDDEIECIAKAVTHCVAGELPEIKKRRARGFVTGGVAGRHQVIPVPSNTKATVLPSNLSYNGGPMPPNLPKLR